MADITVNPVAGRIGAEIDGVDISRPLSAAEIATVQRALDDGYLFDGITRPEYQVRFRWQPGSVAFWDNRATAHLGPQDLGHLDVERVLHRVTLIGEVPVGPDGRESDLVEGTRFVSGPVFASDGAS